MNTICRKNIMKRVTALLIAVMLLCSVPLSALAEGKAAKFNTATRVYQKASTSSASMKVKKGLEVNLLATSGSWAKVERDGVIAYAKLSQLTILEDEKAKYDELMKDAQPAVINANTKVYASAKTSSKATKVKKGMEVNLLAVSGSWAMVENSGAIAYIPAKYVTLASEYEAEPTYEELMKDAQPAVINANTKVYASAKTSSKATKVKKGMEVNLLAVSGSWAMVENGGAIAYIPTKYVTLASEYEAEPTYEELMKNAQPAVITKDTKVYAKANTSSKATKVKKGMEVNLLAVNGSWAMVENNGAIAYMNKAYVSTLEQAATPTPAPTATPVPTATPKPDYSSYLKDAQAAAITCDTKVYESADTASAYTSVSKGLEVQLLAVKDGWALIERSGAYGFVNKDHVAVLPKATATPAPTATPVPTATPAPESGYMASSKYTNEQKCYLFLTKEAGLSTAAACGILANIRRECNFNPAAGSSYYGLCQWGGGRLTNLKNYCASNGYSQSSLEGQLKFLVYELKKSYSSVWNYLQSVPNTAAGAYDAAYHFCYYYERPANKSSSSADRGELARDTYFPRYKTEF